MCGHLSHVFDVADVLSHPKLLSDFRLTALAVRLHHEVVVDLVHLWVSCVLAFADLTEGAVQRDLAQILKIHILRKHIKLLSNLSISALTIWFHQELVVLFVVVIVRRVLRFADVPIGPVDRNVPQVVFVSKIGSHIMLDPELLVGAILVWLHHGLGVHAVLGRVLEWLVGWFHFAGGVFEQLWSLSIKQSAKVASSHFVLHFVLECKVRVWCWFQTSTSSLCLRILTTHFLISFEMFIDYEIMIRDSD